MSTILAKGNIKLTPKQHAFVNEYLICKNGAEAARRAQYKVRSARQMAAENMTKPAILAAIAFKEAQMAEKLELDRNTIVGGIFTGIAQARGLGDPNGIIKGWVAVSKLMGFDKPEIANSTVISASNLALEARFAQMSDAELLAIAEGHASPP